MNISLHMEVNFLLALITTLVVASSQTIVKTLPGYPGPLPFNLETGYVGVGEDESVQLFYYFVESEGNPEKDPLIIWLAGGPGCTTLHGFFYEIGPMRIKYGTYIDNVPALELEPYSWTKVANIIYLDAPTVTGYSYTKTSEYDRSSDTLSASQTAEFIRKFIKSHQKFLKNPMYVCGISYSGILIPIITEELFKGNDDGLKPAVNIKGYIGVNPLTDKHDDLNSRLEYVYRAALISKDLYESTKEVCHEEYAEANPNNLLCMSNIEEIDKRVKDIYIEHILEPSCKESTNLFKIVTPVNKKPENRRSLRYTLKDKFCRSDTYNYSVLWANNENVMKALNVREGTVEEFSNCALDMRYRYGEISRPLYEFDVNSSVVYHKRLSKRNCRALIMSGDHDMRVSYVGTFSWINSLNFTVTNSKWEAWYSNEEVAGYKTTYVHHDYSLAFATVKGAGHTAPEYKHEECFNVVKRWFAQKPI